MPAEKARRLYDDRQRHEVLFPPRRARAKDEKALSGREKRRCADGNRKSRIHRGSGIFHAHFSADLQQHGVLIVHFDDQQTLLFQLLHHVAEALEADLALVKIRVVGLNGRL